LGLNLRLSPRAVVVLLSRGLGQEMIWKPVKSMVTSYSRAAAACFRLILVGAADPGHSREEDA
jgi:hypothetical protein